MVKPQNPKTQNPPNPKPQNPNPPKSKIQNPQIQNLTKSITSRNQKAPKSKTTQNPKPLLKCFLVTSPTISLRSMSNNEISPHYRRLRRPFSSEQRIRSFPWTVSQNTAS